MLTTERLTLIPLSLAQLKTGLSSIPCLSDEIHLQLVPGLFEGVVQRAVSMKIEKMNSQPESVHDWFTYWLIVITRENLGVGLVGYKGYPDSKGEVEIGYGIDQAYRRQGYMSEAVDALVKWAFNHPECKRITAPGVLKENIGSQRTLVHTGFDRVGESPTEIDYLLVKE